MYTTAHNLFQILLNHNITHQSGKTIIEFMGVNLTLGERSAMGDILQEWLGQWMTEHSIKYRVQNNTQEFPDFLLDELSDTVNLLEVKTFDYSRSANFDVANFDAYRRSLLTNGADFCSHCGSR